MAVLIRPFAPADHARVRDIFINWNRHITQPGMEDLFESYIQLALDEEINCIPEYYGRSGFGFWVAEIDGTVAGMVGLERLENGEVEVRRMYVAAEFRRRGIGRTLLAHAEDRARDMGYTRIVLSTSALQPQAKALYEVSGYDLEREEASTVQTKRTVGSGLTRYYFAKPLV
ncbi:MAG: GNAT family N-acetyltransferase [Rhodospirillales bacterium]